MLKHSAKIVHDSILDLLEVVLEDTNAKLSRVLVLRFPIDSCTGAPDLNFFSCAKAKGLAFQRVTNELFWVYHFILEFRNWKEHLDEYGNFCSTRL